MWGCSNIITTTIQTITLFLSFEKRNWNKKWSYSPNYFTFFFVLEWALEVFCKTTHFDVCLSRLGFPLLGIFENWGFWKVEKSWRFEKTGILDRGKIFSQFKKTHRQTDSHIYHMMQILRLGHCIAEYWNSGRTNLHIYYMMLEYK